MEAAFPFQLRMEVNGVAMKTDFIDLFRFNEAGKIISMRPSGDHPIKRSLPNDEEKK